MRADGTTAPSSATGPRPPATCGSCRRGAYFLGVDLSFSAEEQAFAAEVRDWLAANLGEVPAFASFDDEVEWGRAWQARLAAERWVGLHWPAEYGGRGASPVQVALFNTEYSRAPQLVNRVGVNLAGPTLLAHGTDEQKRRWLGRSSPPRRSGASSSASPTPAPTWHRSRPRRSGSTTAGCSPGRRCGPPTRSSPAGESAWPAPTSRRRSTRASRISSSTCRPTASRCARSSRSPVRPSSTRCSSTRCSCPTTIWSVG